MRFLELRENFLIDKNFLFQMYREHQFKPTSDHAVPVYPFPTSYRCNGRLKVRRDLEGQSLLPILC